MCLGTSGYHQFPGPGSLGQENPVNATLKPGIAAPTGTAGEVAPPDAAAGPAPQSDLSFLLQQFGNKPNYDDGF